MYFKELKEIDDDKVLNEIKNANELNKKNSNDFIKSFRSNSAYIKHQADIKPTKN